MSTSTSYDELNFSEKIAEELALLYLNPLRSDIVLVVDGEKLPAHKFVLVQRSSYFQAMFGGSFAESSESEVTLKVPLKAFKRVLRYIYTGRVSFQFTDHETVLNLLGLSEEYGIEELKLGVISHLMENVSLNTCSSVLYFARLYQSKELEATVLSFFDQHATAVLESDDFKTLPIDSLRALSERDTFFLPEIDIFNAVVKWRQHNPDDEDNDFQSIISNIRFELIEWKQMFSVVKESSILSDKRFLEVLRAKAFAETLNYRSDCRPGINVATIEFNAKVIKGGNPSELLNGNFNKNGYTHHTINGTDVDFIIVELDHLFMLNQIDMLLYVGCEFSYYVEVSTNQEQWRRVIDHTKSVCRSWQRLHFETQPLRYIKIVGTKSNIITDLRVVHLAAYYRNNQPTLINGLVSPTTNVASERKCARVFKGEVRKGNNMNVLLNGLAINYIIQLAQPYVIGSVRLLLWDGTCSFFIETSVNGTDWTMAVSVRGESLRSWQEFIFEAHPIVFIRITCTFNSNGTRRFHLAHFEAPSMKDKN